MSDFWTWLPEHPMYAIALVLLWAVWCISLGYTIGRRR